MSSLFVKIVKQAEKTFMAVNKDSLKSNLQILKSLIDKLELKDLRIDERYASRQAFQMESDPPCKYFSIYDTPVFSMSVFILRQSYTMPLHDHPTMKGLLKVIAGELKVQSFSKLQGTSSELLVTQEDPQILNRFSKTSMLDENIGNYHEISASDDAPAAFFDILSPRYSSSSDKEPSCHFYEKIMFDDSGKKNIVMLKEINCPDHYSCDHIRIEYPDIFY